MGYCLIFTYKLNLQLLVSVKDSYFIILTKITKMRKLFISLLPMLFFIVSNHSQALNLGGTIATDSTLSLSNSPYVVTSSLTINQGVKLTIASGVILKFENGVSMNIYGRINATNVTFTSNSTSPSNGIWGNLNFGSASNTDTSFFTGCTIQWASNMYIQNLYTLRLNGCTVAKFSGNPFYINSGGSAFLNNTGVANCNGNIYLPGGKLDCSNSTTIFSVGGTYYGGIDNAYGILNLASTTIQSCAFPIKLGDQQSVLTISGGETGLPPIMNVITRDPATFVKLASLFRSSTSLH